MTRIWAETTAVWGACADEARELKQVLLRLERMMIKRNDNEVTQARATKGGKTIRTTSLVDMTIVGASLLVRHDPDTERWAVWLVSRTPKEDVPVAWKATEEDALAWALNYGVRK